LCPDGSCLGIIGSDGKCTVCGRADSEGSGSAGKELPESADLPEDDLGDDTARNGDEPSPAFDSRRKLCSDGTCIGVIGSDNLCSVCGKPASG
jgi:hypothetical protein